MIKEKIDKIEEIVIPLKPRAIIQAPNVVETNKKCFGGSVKNSEELIRLFYTDKNNKPILYPVESFESDTGWVESVFGKEDSDFRRTIVFSVDTPQILINETIEFIKDKCNPGTDKEYFGWLVYASEDEPMKFAFKTRTK